MKIFHVSGWRLSSSPAGNVTKTSDNSVPNTSKLNFEPPASPSRRIVDSFLTDFGPLARWLHRVCDVYTKYC